MGYKLEMARRAIACKGWRWLGGFLDTSGWRVVGWHESGALWLYSINQKDMLFVTAGENIQNVKRPRRVDGDGIKVESVQIHPDPMLPDFDDDVTRLGLLQLVRDATGLDDAIPIKCGPDDDKWDVCYDAQYLRMYLDADSELEALVAALEET